jgi:putative N6-adenine-specific DNA methylase
MPFFATAAKGTEGALRDELRELRLPSVRADRGGVHFDGTVEHGFRACLGSRIAMRVLLEVGAFDARTPQLLYDGVRALDWSPHLSPRHTLAVYATCRSSALTHTQFIAQKTKDAIVDTLRDAHGARPSVDVRDPDVRIHVHLVRDHARVYLDLAGEPLHKRGYRVAMQQAPLKETLAAAILRLAGWDRTRPLVDPMCGSGTFPIEAYGWSHGVAPGLARERFGVERWASHDDSTRARFAEIRAQARAAVRTEGPVIEAADIDEAAVSATRANARAAGATFAIARRPIEATKPTTPPGLVVVNPPYGERLDADDALFRRMAETFSRLHGHTIAVLAGTPRILRALGVRPKEHTVFNGDLECRLLTWVVA